MTRPTPASNNWTRTPGTAVKFAVLGALATRDPERAFNTALRLG